MQADIQGVPEKMVRQPAATTELMHHFFWDTLYQIQFSSQNTQSNQKRKTHCSYCHHNTFCDLFTPSVSHHHGSLVCILNPKIPHIHLWSIFNLRFNTGCWTCKVQGDPDSVISDWVASDGRLYVLVLLLYSRQSCLNMISSHKLT